MNRAEKDLLVVSGGENWTAEELSELITNLYIVFNRASVINKKEFRSPGGFISQLAGSKSRVDPQEKLVVESMTIASPMNLNLKGSGELLEQLRELIKDLMGRNKIELEEQREQLIHTRIQNETTEKVARVELLSKAVDELARMGASQEERKKVIDAILHPAEEAARVVQEKELTFSKED